MNPVKSVLVAGGGTAGWLCAAYLARTLGDAVRITLVESSEIAPIGVGEGSFPSIRGTLATLGIDEARFLRETSGSFKQGVKFAHWLRPPGAPGADHYFHPFSQPSQRAEAPELLPYWLLGDAGALPFAEACTLQKSVADASRAPKRLRDADYLGPLNYAYHFDAGRLATLLAQQARSLGVRHVVATVREVELDAQGGIAALHTAEAGHLEADLYVDCTGLRASLIGQALGSRWESVQDVLFVDRALALQVPYPRADSPVASYTISTAHEAGWTWDIGLQDRRGIGYVYSSRHASDDEAEHTLRRHVGSAAKGLQPRLLKLQVGYRPVQWVRNCVAIGLSAGFLEPLESSGIGLIETASYLLAHGFPFGGAMEPAARRFNAFMRARFERIVDFLKLHYALTQRDDTAFWRDNADPATWTPTLRDLLAEWRTRPPHRLDFLTDVEMYPPSSWQYVLYGMAFRTDMAAAAAGLGRRDEARREFETISRLRALALDDLPDHRALLAALRNRAAPARAAAPSAAAPRPAASLRG